MGSTRRLPPAISPTGQFALICCNRLAKTSEAAESFDRAIGLAEDPAVRQFLLERRG